MFRTRINSFRSLPVASSLLLGIYGGAYLASKKPRRYTPQENRSSKRIPVANEDRTSVIISQIIEETSSQGSTGSNEYLGIFSRLAERQHSVIPPSGSGVVRYDVAQIASNYPIEDDHAEWLAPTPDGYWSLFGIFDGHSGWETSTWLRENLLVAVTGRLADLYDRIKTAQSPSSEPTSTDIETTFKDTFKEVDDLIVHTSLDLAVSSASKYKATNLLAPAYAGSCALVSFYDSITRRLFVALTGDSRAVLGRRVPDSEGKTLRYEVYELSVDQNAGNAAEEARLNAQHPGEVVVKDGRVLGWGVARAFGDARMKWTVDTQKQLKATLLGRSVSSTLKTPPYFTAEPEVTSIEIQPGDFLIMASDGLWESLTNEEVVGLTGWWLHSRGRTAETPISNMISPTELPVIYPEEYEDKTPRYRQWNVKKHFINTDTNASTHLIRNALGGADEDLVAALLNMRSPRSRTFHDDITATVVFFG